MRLGSRSRGIYVALCGWLLLGIGDSTALANGALLRTPGVAGRILKFRLDQPQAFRASLGVFRDVPSYQVPSLHDPLQSAAIGQLFGGKGNLRISDATAKSILELLPQAEVVRVADSLGLLNDAWVRQQRRAIGRVLRLHSVLVGDRLRVVAPPPKQA